METYIAKSVSRKELILIGKLSFKLAKARRHLYDMRTQYYNRQVPKYRWMRAREKYNKMQEEFFSTIEKINMKRTTYILNFDEKE